jgi:hypothetical protein
MVWLDRTLSILLILAGIVHGFDSLKFYRDELTLLWSVCATLFIILIGAINLLRASRPRDGALAWICLVSGAAWLAAALRFGSITERFVDVHMLLVLVITLGVCLFSIRTLVLAKR